MGVGTGVDVGVGVGVGVALWWVLFIFLFVVQWPVEDHSGFVLQIFDPRLLVFCLQQILLNLIFRLQIFFVFGVKMNNIFPRDHSAAPLLEIRL